MKFSPQQAKALHLVSEYMNTKDSIFYLAGYAGTGKTTLAKHFAENYETLFAAYTGKAALCLRKAGLPDASTIHAILYRPMKDKMKKIRELEQTAAESAPDEQRKMLKELEELKKPQFVLREDSPIQYVDLVVLDECSMINAEMAEDILSFGTKILVLGDPMQLPPISGTGFFTNDKPDYFLTEIHRQALDNPIIALSKHVRENGNVPVNFAENAKRVSKRAFMDMLYAGTFDHTNSQILTGMNKTRHKINSKVRIKLGFKTEYPEEYDKLICLRNNKELDIFNGMFAEVLNIQGLEDDFRFTLDIKTELGNEIEDLGILSTIFEGEEETKKVPYWIQKRREQFDYGYCITVHKSQGSQFDHVFLADDGFLNWEPLDRRRWLYTAVTRAVESVLVA